MAARATFALKAGVWFRRGRLVIVSPFPQPSRPLSGRNSTQRLCPDSPSQLYLPAEAVAARAGLVAHPEPAVPPREPFDQVPDGLGLVGDLARASRLDHRDRDLGLVRIQADAHRPILVHGSSPMPEARRRPARRNPRRTT